MMPSVLSTVAVVATLFALASTSSQNSRSLLGQWNHRYKKGDDVPLYANTIGPLSSPSETYEYYTLPYCKDPKGVRYKLEDLGEVLEGDRLVETLYKLPFQTPIPTTKLCNTKKLSKQDLSLFKYAISNDYYIQYYYDDLPMYQFVGTRQEVEQGSGTAMTRLYLYTHTHFVVQYNDDRVIQISAGPHKDDKLDITDAVELDVTFEYSVEWTKVDTPYSKRHVQFMKEMFNKDDLKVQWFSIINSVVTVILLIVFLATILLRVLKNDFVRFTADTELGEDSDESGWKYIHGDVFRFPTNSNLFAAILGVGTQMLALTSSLFALALLNFFMPHHRGTMLATGVLLYAFTASVAGYTSAYYYKMMGGHHWVRNIVLTVFLFSGPFFAQWSVLNTTAWAYGSTAALPFGTVCVLLLLWAIVTLPLTIFGARFALQTPVVFQAPSRTTKFPRDIPPLPVYRRAPIQMLIAGCLPFSAIYMELHYIFQTVWGYKSLTIFSILAIVFIILLLVTAFVTIALTYFQLAAEDHRWWWRALLCGGSTALYVYAYALWYYWRSEWAGFMQGVFFCGNMLLMSYAFFLMMGAVGFRAAMFFVCYIYRSIKSE